MTVLLAFGGHTYAREVPDKPPGLAEREAGDLIRVLDTLHTRRTVTHLVHGDAPGADKAAGAWAAMRGVPCTPVPVDHAQDGPWPGAGPRRNQRALTTAIELAEASTRMLGFVAFPGKSGTADMCRQITEAGHGDRIWRPFG